jgi:hypothetical protein
VDGLGGVRVTVEAGRREMYDALRLAGRVLPARRRVRRWAWITLVMLGVVLALVAASSPDDAESVRDRVQPVLPAVAAGTVLALAMLSDRLWAWTLARRLTRGVAGGPVRFRIDDGGLSVAAEGRSASFDWSAVTRVVEGEPAVVFVVHEHRSRFQFVAVPGGALGPERRAAIRRYAEAAPGERPWITVPVRRRRSSGRLRVASSPTGG